MLPLLVLSPLCRRMKLERHQAARRGAEEKLTARSPQGRVELSGEFSHIREENRQHRADIRPPLPEAFHHRKVRGAGMGWAARDAGQELE